MMRKTFWLACTVAAMIPMMEKIITKIEMIMTPASEH